MKIPKVMQQSANAIDFITKIERDGNYEGIENFFDKEKKLINHLFRLEKEEAKKEIRVLLKSITMAAGHTKFDSVKYYLIALSAIVVRHLEKKYHMPLKAYAFNRACNIFIEAKLNEQNIIEFTEELIELYIHVLTDKKLPTLLHKTVNNVILLIDDDVESPITVEEIAGKFNISTSHLSRIFREHTGITLIEYINIRKVEESQYYLRFTADKISGISDRFHFCNQSYFTRVFKKYTGQTPREFRRDRFAEYFHFIFPMGKK